MRAGLARTDATAVDAHGTKVHPPIATLLDALTFRLARLNALNERAGSRYFRDACQMSLNEWRVLGLTRALAPLSVQRLRDILLMDKGQLSRTIRQLTERGLITSRPLDGDGRAIQLDATEAGLSLHDQILAFTRERNEAVVGALTPAECRTFLHLLDKISRHNEQLATLAEALE